MDCFDSAKKLIKKKKKKNNTAMFDLQKSGPTVIRTRDLLFTRQAL